MNELRLVQVGNNELKDYSKWFNAKAISVEFAEKLAKTYNDFKLDGFIKYWYWEYR